MSNETPVERFVVLRSLMGMLIDSDGNRVVPTTGNVARAFECVLASDYDKLKAERDEARAALAEDSTLLEKRILEYVQLQGEAAEYCYELAEAKAEHELAVMRFREVDAELAEAKAEIERLTDSPWREAWRIFDIVTAPTDADREAIVGCLVSLGLIRCTDGSDTKRECDAGDARTIFSAIADRAQAPESTEKRPATDQEWAAVESEIAEHRRARAPEREGDEK